MTYHLSSPPGICEVCIPQSFILYAVLCKSLFVLLSFFICPCTLLSAFLQITAPEYHFGFFILCLIYNFISWKINKLGFCFKCVFKGDLRRVQLLDQELPTLPEHLGSLPIFSGVCVTRSLVLCVCFVDRYLSFCTFSFGHCVVCSSSIYGFWLPLWYLLTLLVLLYFFFWPLCCLFFFDIRIVITPLVSFGHCVVCSSIYRLWLPPFGIFKLFL